jgi:hypothetical protein
MEPDMFVPVGDGLTFHVIDFLADDRAWDVRCWLPAEFFDALGERDHITADEIMGFVVVEEAVAGDECTLDGVEWAETLTVNEMRPMFILAAVYMVWQLYMALHATEGDPIIH